jgi:hypothetical protein
MPEEKTASPSPTSLTRVLALTAALAVGGALPACGPSPTDRWVVTENTNVAIDWDAVGKAYLAAEGPEDFERRVNEIYEGDEIISVSVQDLDERTQVVTGFFDKDEDGAAAEGEKIFSLRRDVTSQDAAKYQISGHGAYASYHSPVWDIMMGMAMGSMISRMFMPGYMPMYTAGYTTSPARRGQLASQRSSYRAQNPGKFAKSSGSGRSYGAKGSSWGSKGSTPSSAPRRSGGFGGGRFGLRDRGARERIRLES